MSARHLWAKSALPKCATAIEERAANRAVCYARWKTFAAHLVLLPEVQPGCRSATGNKLVSWAACRGLASIPRIVRRVPVRTRTRVHVCTHTPCFVLRGDAEREGSACLCLEGRPHGAGRVLVSVRSAGILTTVSAIGRDTDLTSYLLGPRDRPTLLTALWCGVVWLWSGPARAPRSAESRV